MTEVEKKKKKNLGGSLILIFIFFSLQEEGLVSGQSALQTGEGKEER